MHNDNLSSFNYKLKWHNRLENMALASRKRTGCPTHSHKIYAIKVEDMIRTGHGKWNGTHINYNKGCFYLWSIYHDFMSFGTLDIAHTRKHISNRTRMFLIKGAKCETEHLTQFGYDKQIQYIFFASTSTLQRVEVVFACSFPLSTLAK